MPLNEFLAPVAIVLNKSGATSFVGKQTGSPTPADGAGTRIKVGARLSIQAIWTGTLTGTLSVEGCNWSTDGVNGTWTPLTVTLHGTQPAGAPGSFMIDPLTVAAAWIRVRWTSVSGAGNITVYIVGKGS
jgi:hypothetical protein